jgi:hypothetical protein
VADDDVVEDFDAEGFAGGDEVAGDFEVFGGGLRIAGGRVVGEDDGGGFVEDGRVENFAGVIMPLRDSVGSQGATFPADLISAIEPAAEHETAAAVKNIQIVKAA